MRYVEASPCAALAPYVQCYWALELSGEAPVGVHRVMPDGCLDILVDLTGGVGLHVVGAMRAAEVVPLSARAAFVAVRFRPGGAQPFLGLPLLELTDAKVALEDLWPREAREWRERLGDVEGRRRASPCWSGCCWAGCPGRRGTRGCGTRWTSSWERGGRCRCARWRG